MEWPGIYRNRPLPIDQCKDLFCMITGVMIQHKNLKDKECSMDLLKSNLDLTVSGLISYSSIPSPAVRFSETPCAIHSTI